METDMIDVEHMLQDLNALKSAFFIAMGKMLIDINSYMKQAHKRYRVMSDLSIIIATIVKESDEGIASDEVKTLFNKVIGNAFLYSVIPFLIKKECMKMIHKRIYSDGGLDAFPSMSKYEKALKEVIRAQGLTEAGTHSLYFLVKTIILLS